MIEVGRTYAVTLNDCCIEGAFVATLVSMREEFGEDEDTEFPQLTFSNGVTLTNWSQAVFEEARGYSAAG